MKTVKRKKPNTVGVIQGDALYTVKEFHKAAGIGYTTRQRARDAGLPLPVFVVGRNTYVKGEVGIAWLQSLAALSASASN